MVSRSEVPPTASSRSYVLDFYSAAAKLGIEVDGVAHETSDLPDRDTRRDAWIEGRGIRMPRIPAAEVVGNLEGELSRIL